MKKYEKSSNIVALVDFKLRLIIMMKNEKIYDATKLFYKVSHGYQVIKILGYKLLTRNFYFKIGTYLLITNSNILEGIVLKPP